MLNGYHKFSLIYPFRVSYKVQGRIEPVIRYWARQPLSGFFQSQGLVETGDCGRILGHRVARVPGIHQVDTGCFVPAGSNRWRNGLSHFGWSPSAGENGGYG